MLSAQDRAALDLEARFWHFAGTKEMAIRRELGESPIRHYQRVVRLLGDPEAIAYAPMTCARLRAVLERRQRRVA
ncbi:DUF3263 domain-containing protein [Cellulomonas denverensis]|uniref:DUF3263 domain-containing protein n=1 Tax=Cellulomonas denverensis TaxID=264297 RepID=A0A7X6KTW7_9CELL|nr:DUF3263 domain-containing protein [Cellulomonas denverensis]NKY22172.1 DUF3263 domain-containing protein [Cellulomonas denverensis]GIG27135.1 hypothetical protein Cde04nite_33790 [Cellulomonas denverensis]